MLVSLFCELLTEYSNMDWMQNEWLFMTFHFVSTFVAALSFTDPIRIAAILIYKNQWLHRMGFDGYHRLMTWNRGGVLFGSFIRRMQPYVLWCSGIHSAVSSARHISFSLLAPPLTYFSTNRHSQKHRSQRKQHFSRHNHNRSHNFTSLLLFQISRALLKPQVRF